MNHPKSITHCLETKKGTRAIPARGVPACGSKK